MSNFLNFPIEKIKEGSVEIFIPREKKISKQLPVFYNPAMKLNRDITILLLQQFPPMNLCDPLAASGIRAIRFAKELKYKSITANDMNKKAVALIKKNMRYNKVNFEVYNKDANLLLLESFGFDFIDLDVFGSPNFMLDAACKRISRNGILAVTATDTSALCGTYYDACKRKYWAAPKSSQQMHEIGLRILIRKVQLVAAQYDKALVPIFSYSKDHYMRIFLRVEKNKNAVDEILKHHKMLKDAGPLWAGKLWDENLAKKMWNSGRKSKIFSGNKELLKFLEIVKEESKIDSVGFHDIHHLCKSYKLQVMPKKAELIKEITRRGFKASETHFRGEGIRSDIDEKNLVDIMKKSR